MATTRAQPDRALATPARSLPVLAALALAVTVTGAVAPHLVREHALALLLVGVVALVVHAVGPGRNTAPTVLTAGRGRRLVAPTVEMALHLSPVALLTLVFPLASARLDGVTVGGASLITLLLASSLTVPWLAQAVCLPVYRAIGALVPAGDLPVITRRFCEVWPTSFVQSTPLLLLFVVPVELTLHWSPLAVATYLALCLLHVGFAQSLVMANVARDRVRWAAAWAAYAATLFALPELWFLPPLAGLATQLWWMRDELSSVRRPVWLDHRDVALDLGRGLLLGSVLWADKLFLFLVTDGVFAVDTVFLALLPAILAYNYYFVRLAPGFD